jgi:putative ABC transport system permease protein
VIYHGEIWKISLDALRANKIKSFLTMLGVVIGSCSIVLVVTISLAGRNYIVAQVEAAGSNLVWAELRLTGVRGTTLGDEITLADLEALRREIPYVVETAGTRDLQMSVVAASVERPVTLVAVTEGFQRIRRLVVVAGRYFDDADMRSHAKTCLVTEELARAVFPGVSPVGQDIRVGELKFTVIGVFKERISTFGQSEIARESIIVPFDLLKSYAGTDTVKVLYAQASTPESVPGVTRETERLLRSRHRASALYDVENVTAVLEATRKISLALSMVLLGVGGTTLIISGVGIMNIMLVTVRQRTREIGVRKALGAGKREILYQFLLEALLVGASGGLLGILIAAGIPIIVRPFIPAGLTIPVSRISIAVAFVISCMTGVIFGYLPASRAANLQPTEALRYE